MMDKFISVIIPTYNRGQYLAKAIQSVMDQDFGEYESEIIIVDDGSTDDTNAIVKKFGTRVRYKKIRHTGKPAVARNVGLQLARGELIAFQDSDDVWPKNKMTKQLPYFNDATIVLTYGQASIIDQDGNETGEYVAPSENLKYGEKFRELIKTNVISTLTVVARKASLTKAGGFDESDSMRGVEDYELWLRLLAQNPEGFRCIDETLAFYRKHTGNLSATTQLVSLRQIYTALLTVWDQKLKKADRIALEMQLTAIQENISRVILAQNKAPKVSVVMSVYNGTQFIDQATKSILKQTLTDFEFIIIDDGSDDDTVATIKQYDDSRIRLIPQVNHGLVYSLNKAISLATAPFIARMDADDVSLDSRLQKEYDWLSAQEDRGLVSTFFEHIEYGLRTVAMA